MKCRVIDTMSALVVADSSVGLFVGDTTKLKEVAEPDVGLPLMHGRTVTMPITG